MAGASILISMNHHHQRAYIKVGLWLLLLVLPAWIAAHYSITGKANYGVVFKTLKRKRGWVKVRHEDGLEGWIQRDLLWGW